MRKGCGMRRKHRHDALLILSLGLLQTTACGERKQDEVAPAPTVKPIAPPKEDVPEIVVEEPVHDFGKMYRGQTGIHVFTVKNVGNAPLVIQEIVNTCRCSAAVASTDEIPPGGEGEIRATLDTWGMAEKLSKDLAIYSNDPKKPAYLITLKADVVEDVRFIPSKIYFGEVLTGEKATETLRLKVLVPEKVSISGVSCDDDRFKVEKGKVSGDESTYTIHFSGSETRGHINASVQVKLEGANFPQMDRPVEVDIVGNLRAPQSLILDKRDGAFTEKKFVLESRDKRAPFKVAEITDSNDNLRFDVIAEASTKTVVKVNVKDPVTNLDAPLEGTIQIETTDKRDPLLKFDYSEKGRGSR